MSEMQEGHTFSLQWLAMLMTGLSPLVLVWLLAATEAWRADVWRWAMMVLRYFGARWLPLSFCLAVLLPVVVFALLWGKEAEGIAEGAGVLQQVAGVVVASLDGIKKITRLGMGYFRDVLPKTFREFPRFRQSEMQGAEGLAQITSRASAPSSYEMDPAAPTADRLLALERNLGALWKAHGELSGKLERAAARFREELKALQSVLGRVDQDLAQQVERAKREQADALWLRLVGVWLFSSGLLIANFAEVIAEGRRG